MNIKLKPPCKVSWRGLKYSLRAVDHPNSRMKRTRWPRGLVAKLNGYGGTMIVPYRDLKPWTDVEG